MNDIACPGRRRTLWDRMAGNYDRQVERTYQETYDRSIQLVREIVTPTAQVLEMGCGTSIISLAVAPAVTHVTATDFSSDMIAVAENKAIRAEIDNITFRVADSQSLPYDDASFDVVLLFNVLHFVKEPARMLGEVHRLLKQGGLVSSATDCYSEPAGLGWRLKLFSIQMLHIVGAIPHIWRFTKQDIDLLFEQSGFAI